MHSVNGCASLFIDENFKRFLKARVGAFLNEV